MDRKKCGVIRSQLIVRIYLLTYAQIALTWVNTISHGTDKCAQALFVSIILSARKYTPIIRNFTTRNSG